MLALVMNGPFGLSILQMILIIALLGLVAGLIDRAPVIDGNFKLIIKWMCIIAAVLLFVAWLLGMAGLV